MHAISVELKARGFTEHQARFIVWNIEEALVSSERDRSDRNKVCQVMREIVERGRITVAHLDDMTSAGIEARAAIAEALQLTDAEVVEVCDGCLMFADAVTLMAFSQSVMRRHRTNVVRIPPPAARLQTPKQVVHSGQSSLL